MGIEGGTNKDFVNTDQKVENGRTKLIVLGQIVYTLFIIYCSIDLNPALLTAQLLDMLGVCLCACIACDTPQAASVCR